MNSITQQLDNVRHDLIEMNTAMTGEAVLWDQLTLAQEFSVCSLGQFGYTLTEVKKTPYGQVALLSCDGKTASISSSGYIRI